MVEIIPAIIPRDLADIRTHMARVQGIVPLVQIDVVDGIFADNTTWPYTPEGTEEFRKIAAREREMPLQKDLDFEVDLMVSEPERVVEDWVHAGARRIIVHVESTKHMDDILAEMEALVRLGETDDMDVHVPRLGIAMGIETPIERIESYIERIDFVQVMGIREIGRQGEHLDEMAIFKVADLRARHPELVISVDGGVRLENAHRLVEAGANRLVAGSAVYGSDDPEAVLKAFAKL